MSVGTHPSSLPPPPSPPPSGSLRLRPSAPPRPSLLPLCSLPPRSHLLVPVLDEADEALQLGRALLQEGSLQLREAGGELALFPQALALLDEPDVDLGVRYVVFGHLTC